MKFFEKQNEKYNHKEGILRWVIVGKKLVGKKNH
jgi:hypothetical protein